MMQLSQELKVKLSKTKLLQNLSNEGLEKIAQIAIQKNFHSGELLFSEGDPSIGSFLILSGRVKVFKTSQSGREQILGLLGSGDYLAGVPSFDGNSYSTFAMALMPAEILYFPRDQFLAQLQQDPTLAWNLLTIFSHRLRRFAQLIENLSLKEVSGRLATYLVSLSHQSNNQEVVLELTKGQLAAFIGTLPETLSRILQKLSRDGLLRIDGSTIMILDIQRLQALASCHDAILL